MSGTLTEAMGDNPTGWAADGCCRGRGGLLAMVFIGVVRMQLFQFAGEGVGIGGGEGRRRRQLRSFSVQLRSITPISFSGLTRLDFSRTSSGEMMRVAAGVSRL